MKTATPFLSSAPRYGSGLRVLVVDDSADVADMLLAMLKHLGHTAQACYTGDECLDCVEQFLPDLVLMDITMPVLDGFDVFKRLRTRAATRGIPVIACTCWARPTLVRQQQFRQLDTELQFDGYLQKPVSLAALQAALTCVYELRATG